MSITDIYIKNFQNPFIDFHINFKDINATLSVYSNGNFILNKGSTISMQKQEQNLNIKITFDRLLREGTIYMDGKIYKTKSDLKFKSIYLATCFVFGTSDIDEDFIYWNINKDKPRLRYRNLPEKYKIIFSDKFLPNKYLQIIKYLWSSYLYGIVEYFFDNNLYLKKINKENSVIIESQLYNFLSTFLPFLYPDINSFTYHYPKDSYTGKDVSGLKLFLYENGFISECQLTSNINIKYKDIINESIFAKSLYDQLNIIHDLYDLDR